MIVEKFTLALHDGRPCVAYSGTRWDVPRVVTHYWPLTGIQQSREDWEELGYVFGTPLESLSTGSGLFREVAGYSYQKNDYNLQDGSRTEPIHTEEEDAIRPRGLKPSDLWEDGRWVRRLKGGKIRNILPAQFNPKESPRSADS